MRLSRLPAAVLAAALLTGAVSCAATVEGSGAPAPGVVAGGPMPTGESTGQPTGKPSGQPTGAPATQTPAPGPAGPTTNPVLVKERLLCALERSAISSINSQFNKSKDRDGQIRILRGGVTTVRSHITRSGLPAADVIRSSAQGVLDQLTRLVAAAGRGESPSTQPYNLATAKFQKACNGVS